jgi:hypothetical protein
MSLGRMAVLAALGLAVIQSAPAWGQAAYCDRLRGELASLDQVATDGRAQIYNEQARRQRAELDRTIAYARSVGCQRQRFLFFGDPPPAQCGALEAQINRMEAGLAQLDAQAQRAGGAGVEAQRRSILAALDANCRGVPPGAAVARRPGLFEELFGGQPGSAEVPPMPEDELSSQPELPSGIADSGKTLCVRKCDGYYFPISQNASSSRYQTDAQLCQASCPNTEAELFVQPSGADVKDAVSLSGEYYSTLPNAFRYRTSFDAACTCKRAGQSWVEALSQAEQYVDKRSTDVTVTEEQAQEMSRVKPTAPAAPAKPAGKAPASAAKPASPAPQSRATRPQANAPAAQNQPAPTLRP